MKLFFIRHGETPVNVKGRVHLQNDPNGLSSTGREQIEAAANQIKDEGVEIVYTSLEPRAIESAEIIRNLLGAKVELVPDLAERNWGEWASYEWIDIKKKLDKMGIEERYRFIPPKGESWEQMEARFIYFMKQISKTSHKNIVIIVHEGAMRSIIPYLTAQDKSMALSYQFNNGSITKFEYSGGKYQRIN